MTITGIVDANGAGGSRNRGERLWTLLFTLICWRIGSGKLRHDPVTIRRRVQYDAIDERRELIPGDSIITVTARLANECGWNRPQALLQEFRGQDSTDLELQARLKVIQFPPPIKTQDLGTLTLDRRVNWYPTRRRWGRRSVQILLNPTKDGVVDEALRIIREMRRNQATWHRRVVDCASSATSSRSFPSG